MHLAAVQACVEAAVTGRRAATALVGRAIRRWGGRRGRSFVSAAPISFFGGADLGDARRDRGEGAAPARGRARRRSGPGVPAGHGLRLPVPSPCCGSPATGAARALQRSCRRLRHHTVAVGAIIAEIPCASTGSSSAGSPPGRGSPCGERRSTVSQLTPDAVVKLGGSVLTDKAGGALVVDEALVARLAAELAAHRPERLVVVHGAGSFGHRIGRSRGSTGGRRTRPSRRAMGETQRLQYELDAIVVRLLLAAGLPAMPVQASATAVLEDGALVHLDLTALGVLLEQGLVPVLYGVPAVDRVRGCAILSGDVIAPHVAHALGLGRLVHATDVDGVFTADPRADPQATRIPRVHRGNWAKVRAPRRVRLGRRDRRDGGQGRGARRLGGAGAPEPHVDARVPGRLAAAPMDEPVGTR
ncbi:MAG: isopentenyl phosphate kinase [Sphingobacterium sp.]|nr:isopentenyl phosphate kinase [Sphingobacterium sp.]